MSTGNFAHYDSPYIYVPKVFRGGDSDLVEDDLDFIADEVRQKVNEFIKKIVSPKIDAYIEDGHHDYRRDTKDYFSIHILQYDKDNEVVDENYIDFFFSIGYYEAGNFDYKIIYDTETEVMENLVKKITSVIDRELNEYCDKYGVSARFSSGETWYKKIK